MSIYLGASTFAISLHPFKEGIYGILKQHFTDSIVEKFRLDFEKDVFNKDNESIRRQVKDQNLVLEVRFRNEDGTHTYICDLFSWWTKPQTEHQLLKYITDKLRTGKLKTNWKEVNGKISDEITSGKFETKDVQAS